MPQQRARALRLAGASTTGIPGEPLVLRPRVGDLPPRARMDLMALVVNGEAVDDSVVLREANALLRRFRQLSPEQRRELGTGPGGLREKAMQWAQETVVESVVVRQKALMDPAPLDESELSARVDREVKRRGGPAQLEEAGLSLAGLREQVEQEMRVQRLLDSVAAKVKRLSRKQVADYYRRNMEQFRTQETVRAAHIVKNVEQGVTEEQAGQAVRELQRLLDQGADFAELADKHSDCPGNGGDLGYFPRGKMVKEFEDVAFGLKVGQRSDVFRTAFGFHIVKVLDRRAGSCPPFRQVQGQVRAQALKQRRQKVVEKYLDGLIKSAVVEYRP